MMAQTITATMIPYPVDARFVISHGVRSITDKDGTAILNLQSGKFHSLVSVGSLVWTKLRACPEGATVKTIVDFLLAEKQFVSEPRTQIEQAVQRMLSNLALLGILHRTDLAIPSASSIRLYAALFPLIRLVGSLLISLRLHVLAALLYLTIFYIMLKTVGFGGVYQAVKNWPVSHWKTLDYTGIGPLCEALDKACVWFPKLSMCLARSVVATCLLRQSGISTALVIAAQKNPFIGHAWTEVNEIVVNDKQKVREDFLVFERI